MTKEEINKIVDAIKSEGDLSDRITSAKNEIAIRAKTLIELAHEYPHWSEAQSQEFERIAKILEELHQLPS